MKKLIDLPIGLIAELVERKPYTIENMAMNQISGAVLLKLPKKRGKKCLITKVKSKK